jgi:hypothetical protein
MGRYHYVFPRWSNLLLPGAIVVAMVAPLYVVYVVAFGFSPMTTDVGYAPEQVIEYSHKLHAGELGIDCRYCHNTVEYAARAAIPPTQTCMNCHAHIHKDSPKLEALRRSYELGTPVHWTRVHDLPDYAYFNHAAHVNRGVSCVSCHGRVDRMDVMTQMEPLNMGWCLDCHRNPTQFLRDPKLVTNLGWTFQGTEQELVNYHEQWHIDNNINPSQDCSTCHR